MAKWHEQLAGGLASGRSPDDFDCRELARGAMVECEHTGNFLVAVEIAMDHLTEDPRYYHKLAKVERKPKRKAKKKKVAKKNPPKLMRYGSRLTRRQRVNQLVRDQFRDIYDR